MKKIYAMLYSWYPFVFLGLFLGMLFWQVFLKGFVFIDGDNFHLNMPLKYIFVDAFHQRYFPFWNPYILAGVPYAADLNLGTFNPLNVVFLLFNVPRALTMQVILDLFLIGSFQYIFLKSLKFSKIISLIGACVFMLSGTVFTFTSNSSILHVIVYIPLLFYLTFSFFQKKSQLYFTLLILAQALQIISGHPQVTYYTIVFLSIYMLFQTQCTLKKRLIFICVYICFSLLLSAFQLIPFFEYVLQSTRPIASLTYASSGTMDFSHLLIIFFPTIFGTRFSGNWWGSQAMLFGYMGIAPFVFLLFGIFYGKIVNRGCFLFSLCITFLLSLGKFGLLFYVFYYLFPGWSAFRSPADIFILTTFFATLFVASGMQAFLHNPNLLSKWRKILFSVVVIVVVIVGSISLATIYGPHWRQVFLILQYVRMPFVEKILFYSPSKIQSMFNGITDNLLLFSCMMLVTLLLLRVQKKYKKTLLILFLFFISFDLFFADRTFLQLGPVSFYVEQLPAISLEKDQFRIFSVPLQSIHDRRFLPGPDFFYNEGRQNLLELTDNHVMPFGVMDITGYSALVPKGYTAFIQNGSSITGVNTSKISQKELDVLGVKYILALNAKGALQIKNNPTALPRIRLKDMQQGNSVTIVSSKPNEVILSAFSKQQNIIIRADNYFPGWKAYINGKETKVYMYDSAFQQIMIPQGKSLIIFRYDPISWKIGIGISFVGLVLLFLFRKRLTDYA